MSVILPIGSEQSSYELRILKTVERPLRTSVGSAVLENRNVVLRLRADLAGVAPGRYLLGIRKGTFQWTYYPIVLTPGDQ